MCELRPAAFWLLQASNGQERFLPLNCRLGTAAQHEAGVTFDADGFTLTKFGRSIRVDYYDVTEAK